MAMSYILRKQGIQMNLLAFQRRIVVSKRKINLHTSYSQSGFKIFLFDDCTF
jgi:hypothetical protein